MAGHKGTKPTGSGRPSETRQIRVRGDQIPPKAPADLGPHAKRVWDLAVGSLPDVLRPLDEPILRMCCEAYQSAMDLKAKMDRSRKFNSSIHGAMCRAMRLFESHAKQIGLTPSSRRVVKPVEPGEQDEVSPFEEFLKQGGLN